jgi:hypothetical protein
MRSPGLDGAQGAAEPINRLIITVCARELGTVVLPIVRHGPARRLDARGILRQLRSLVEARDLGHRVHVREACAGGCTGSGPNVSVTIHPAPAPGERGDSVATGWKTYVYSLPMLDCLARVIEENLDGPRAGRPRPRAR